MTATLSPVKPETFFATRPGRQGAPPILSEPRAEEPVACGRALPTPCQAGPAEAMPTPVSEEPAALRPAIPLRGAPWHSPRPGFPPARARRSSGFRMDGDLPKKEKDGKSSKLS
ncbi:uncharacterized protein LOC106697398 [Myotis lucifugus]|uniref:uncharacterized protein LOC106697398 n=1 Tax=Myotis lucifugus TaxID=59463 RepID=UPI0006D71990|nr:uncharacterized protein LOC106697398 [Myotis lucifugus]